MRDPGDIKKGELVACRFFYLFDRGQRNAVFLTEHGDAVIKSIAGLLYIQLYFIFDKSVFN